MLETVFPLIEESSPFQNDCIANEGFLSDIFSRIFRISPREKFDEIPKFRDQIVDSTLLFSKSPEPLPLKYMILLAPAYVDNELNSRENIMMKKMTISNPGARRELEAMYKFQKVLGNAYNKTKNDFKYDYSKEILHRLHDGKEYTTTYFYKLMILFSALLLTIIGGFLYLYF